jgi:hypothetical protein
MRGLWRVRKLRDDVVTQLRLVRAKRRISAFPSIGRKRRHGLLGELIISLTSYPPRFATLSLTLRSLLDQSVAADRTILWVTPEDRSNLPSDVIDLANRGLEIHECEDWRSYKKLVPALRQFPEAFIVTADDDLYFDSKWLETLVGEGRASPRSVITHRAHLALRDECGTFRPYSEWQLDTKAVADQSSQAVIFPTGGAGTLYPPGAFDPRVTDSSLFMRLCPFADDVWFFWMARLAGTKQQRTGRHSKLLWWEGSQEVGLFHENLWGSRNDTQIEAMEAFFGKLPLRVDWPRPARNRNVA